MTYKPILNSAEKVEVQILVDNITDPLSTNPSSVQSELSSLLKAGMKEWAGEAICCANFGLSLLITAYTTNGAKHSVLFDSGPEGYAIERNSIRLGIDFGFIESVVLSHGHWDHGGGLLKAIELIREQNRNRNVNLYMHPDMFRRRAIKLPTGKVLPFRDIPSSESLNKAGATVINSREPQLLQENFFFVSGEIPRITDYEKGFPNHMHFVEDDSKWEPDPLIMDERYFAALVPGRGTTILSACSHAGVVNACLGAQRVFDRMQIDTVLGGYHLAGKAMEARIPETVHDLETLIRPRLVAPGHCTGWRAKTALSNSFAPRGYAPSVVGSVYSLKAE